MYIEIKKHIKEKEQCFVVWVWVCEEVLIIKYGDMLLEKCWHGVCIMCCEKWVVCIITVCLIPSQMLDLIQILIQFPYIISYKFSNWLKETTLWKSNVSSHNPMTSTHTHTKYLTCIQVSLCVPFSKSLHTLTPLVCDMLYSFAICPGGTNSSFRLDRNSIGTWCTYLIVLYDLHVWCTKYTKCLNAGNICGTSKGYWHERECVCEPLYLLDAPFQITYHTQKCVFNDQCIEFILVSRYKTDSHRTS